MHHAAFQSVGLHGWQYDLWDTPADQLPARILEVRCASDIAGANVTVPHKEAVLPLLDARSPAAERIGAVNTIYKRDGLLIGDNTDCTGFLADLRYHGVAVSADTRALVLGAGGSARAVVYALLQCGARVNVYNRTLARAAALASAMGDSVRACSSLREATRDVSLIVNCTSLGMSPQVAASPWDEAVPFPPDAVLYDLVYNPRHTRLMQQAERAGLRVISGLGMLAEQGAAAFGLWTGVASAQVSSIMRQVLESHA